MRLLIDSNRYTDFDNGVPEVVKRFNFADEPLFSLIVLGELRGGFAAGSKTIENEEYLRRFLSRPNVKVLKLDEATAEYYALVFSNLRRQGRIIPTNDIWIAAQALQYELELDTRDRHFKHVPGLKLVE